MRAQDLMSHPAITCHVNDTLHAAAKLMADHECGAIPVVRDDGKLAGIVTDRDIALTAMKQGRSLEEILVNSAMSRHAIAVQADRTIDDVENLMAKHQVRRIPVIDSDNKPVGILSLDDLALESAQPDSRMRSGLARVAHTLAAIVRPRKAHA